MKASANSTSNIEPIPAGMTPARCVSVIDLGTHDTEWQGEAKTKHELLITWEIPDERIEIEKDGEKKDLPRVISKRYTLSLHEKAVLRADLQAWRGKAFTAEELKGFDVESVLGAPCLLNIVHRESGGKTYANVATVSPLMKGQEPPAPELETTYFCFDDYTDTAEPMPEGMPEWQQEIAKESKEYKSLLAMEAAGTSDAAIRSEEVPMGNSLTDEEVDENLPF